MLERMINVIHYVYFKFIEPKNGVYHINGMSVLRLDILTLWNYNYVIVSQNILVWILREKQYLHVTGILCLVLKNS